MARRGGRANSALTQLVLDTYGRVCWLRLPGCIKVATTKDHIVPVIHGGTDELDNLQPACRPCNSKRQQRGGGRSGPAVRVVTGPPGAGKTTLVAARAGSRDVVIDLDALCCALMAEPPADGHTFPEYVRHVGIGARAAAVARATRLRERVGVWIIHSRPNPDQLAEYRGLGYQVIEVDPGRATVMERIATSRPADMAEVAAAYYSPAPAEASPVGITPSRDW